MSQGLASLSIQDRARQWADIRLLGAGVLCALVLVTYYPALAVGFWGDVYDILFTAGSFSWPEFLAQVFNPSLSHLSYRPMLFLQWRLQYLLFGGNAPDYQIVQNLFHLFNCLLLYALVARICKNWRSGFLVALLYSVLSNYAVSVFCLGVPDSLAAFWALTATWFWVSYLEHGRYLAFVSALIAFVIALLTKEIAITVPLIFLLIDRWVIAKPASLKQWILRNIPFFCVIPIWGILDWSALGNALGPQSPTKDWSAPLSRIFYYISAEALPWAIDSPLRLVMLIAIIGVFVYALLARNWRVLFIGAVGLIVVIPLGAVQGIGTRYLYIPMMVSTVGAGLVLERFVRFLRSRRVSIPWALALACLVALLTVRESTATANVTEEFGGTARQTRLQFRSIFQQHPTFQPGTLLYFLEPPFSSYNVAGLMFLHYGRNVTVQANDYPAIAKLSNYRFGYLIYPDETLGLAEQAVEANARVGVSPNLPVQFGDSLLLEGFEAVNTRAHPGNAIILLSYWRALKPVDKDYTIFAHLVDANGTLIAGRDGQPHRGAMPTSAWKPGTLVVEGIVLTTDADTPLAQDARVELGLYDLATMERLTIHGAQTDTVVFSTFQIEP